jgi:hypothetical protein
LLGHESNIHLLNLVDEGLFQVKSLSERLVLDGAERLENSDVSSLDDYAESTKSGDEQNDDENDGNSASKYRVHDRRVATWPNRFLDGIGLIGRNGA